MIGVGIGLPFYRSFGSGVDAQAQVHYNRVIADGGVVPSGLSGVNAFFSAVKAIYGTSDINTAISAAYDAHYLGYKLGAGSGTTLGQAAQKLYAPKGIFGGIGTGSAFYDGTGVAFNFVSTPNAAANQITGDIEINARFIHRTSGSEQIIIAKNQAATNLGYRLRITNGNNISFTISLDGSTIISVLSTFTLTNNQEIWVRCTRNATTGVMNLFTSNDGITYTLNNTATNATGNIFNTTSILTIGSNHNGASDVCHGRIYRATIANSIGGTPVVDFNPNQYTGANTWTSTTSEVWTVNSTGAGLADVVQTTAASQPLLLAHTGENYWFGSGVSGNYCSCTSITINYTALDFRALVTHYDTTLSATATVISQDTNTLQIFNTSTTTCVLVINWKDGLGTSRFRTSSSLLISSLANLYIRATVEQVGIDQIAKFYTSTDGITYTLFSTAASIVTTGFLSVTFSPNVGAFSNGSGTSKIKVSRATISNSIGGAPVVDFNPASYNPATSQTQWTSATGEVWSISTGTATSGYKGAVITKSIVMSDGVDDTMQTSSAIWNSTSTVYSVINFINLNLKLGTSVDSDTTNSSILRFEGLDTVNNYFAYQGGVGLSRNISTRNNLLTMYNSVRNNTSSALNFNNGTDTTGTLNTVITTGVKILGNRNNTATYFTNGNLNTILISSSANSGATRTAIYNYLRSINNNAF